MLLFFSCDNLFNPNSHGESLGEPHPEPIGVNEMIDATSFSAWNYYRITDDSLLSIPLVLGEWDNSFSWDIAFQRNHIRTNSGTSGIGNAGAYVDSVETWNGTVFNSLNDIDSQFDYFPDTTLNTFYDSYNHIFSEGSSNPSLETWARIDTTNNYTALFTNNKLIIRTADGESFYKIWPFDYYDENNNSGYISLIYSLICRLDVCGVCGGDIIDVNDCETN